MNPQKLLQDCVRNPDFLSVSGSRLYGTNREDSDYDYRGFVFPPFEYLLNIHTFKDMQLPEEEDYKVYSVKRFLELVIMGDPQCTELFFVPDSLVKQRSELAKEVLALKDVVVSQNMYRRILGYGNSEFRKARGERLNIEGRTKNEDDVIFDIRHTFDLDKSDTDSVIEILLKNKKKTIVSSKKNLGSKRKAEFDKYGFGVSSATHAIRLTQQLIELLETGNITLPRPNADFLRDVRQGRYTIEEVSDIYDQIVAEAEAAKEKTHLREKPDNNRVWDVYKSVVVKYLKADSRFVTFDINLQC